VLVQVEQIIMSKAWVTKWWQQKWLICQVHKLEYFFSRYSEKQEGGALGSTVAALHMP
jgi:hypothetical protein